MSFSLRRRIRLPDGRLLGFDEHNVEGTEHVFYFHGVPSARVDFHLFDGRDHLEALDMRVIAIDRPGMGLSDPQPDRRLIDLAEDVSHLASSLGIRRFALLGYSGGVPYALACAQKLASQVTALGLVSGTAPFGAADASFGRANAAFFAMARLRPKISRLQLGAIAEVLARAPRFARAVIRATFVGRDREALGRPRIAERVAAFLEEAMVSGPAGAQLDAALIAGPWGFEPADVRCPAVLHHGDADRNVPVEMGRHLARLLPNCRATVHSGEGHVSLIVNHAGAILADLRAAIRASRP